MGLDLCIVTFLAKLLYLQFKIIYITIDSSSKIIVMK